MGRQDSHILSQQYPGTGDSCICTHSFLPETFLGTCSVPGPRPITHCWVGYEESRFGAQGLKQWGEGLQPPGVCDRGEGIARA